MSRFENYSDASQTYDDTRVCLGIDTVQGVCADLGTDLAVLDVGCGTGNYLAALRQRVDGQLGRIVGVDFNQGMLDKACAKFSDDARVSWLQGSAYDLPLDDDSFDLVLCTQVLHHLDAGPDDFPNIAGFTREVRRVLKPGGVLVLNTCAHEQLMDGFWWAALIPNAMGQIRDRLPDVSWLNKALQDAGFSSVKTAIPKGVLQGEAYFDTAGPLDATWRLGDSTWTLASADELQSAITRVQDLIDRGQMATWFAEREAIRAKIGQTTFLIAG